MSSLARQPWSRKKEELEQEIEQLRHAIETRPVIDWARGVLMASFGCQAEDAWQILVEASQNGNVKLRTVADAVTGQEPIPADLQGHLQAAVQVWRSREHELGAGG